MRSGSCAVCSVPFDGQAAYLTKGSYWASRRWNAISLLICASCYGGRRGYFNFDHRALPVCWTGVVGRGEELPPAPCEACGQPFIRNAEALLKRHTCSAACTTSLTRSRNGNKGSGKPCETCGRDITAGRADSRYCSPACRQKAYRHRMQNSHV